MNLWRFHFHMSFMCTAVRLYNSSSVRSSRWWQYGGAVATEQKQLSKYHVHMHGSARKISAVYVIVSSTCTDTPNLVQLSALTHWLRLVQFTLSCRKSSFSSSELHDWWCRSVKRGYWQGSTDKHCREASRSCCTTVKLVLCWIIDPVVFSYFPT